MSSGFPVVEFVLAPAPVRARGGDDDDIDTDAQAWVLRAMEMAREKEFERKGESVFVTTPSRADAITALRPAES